MQLINADVYEKDAQTRARAIEKTRVQNQQMRDARERAKLRSHFSYLAHGRPTGSGSGSGSNTPQSYQIVVEGIPFAVAKNGSKLVKLPGASLPLPVSPPRSPGYDFYEDSAYSSLGDPNPASSTPKTAIVGGVKFYRSKNGNLYRHGVVKAQQRYVPRGLGNRVALTGGFFSRRRGSTIKKTDEPCRAFSTTGIFRPHHSPPSTRQLSTKMTISFPRIGNIFSSPKIYVPNPPFSIY